MNKAEYNYIATTFADYVAVIEGRKPLLIVSAGKSEFALETIIRLASASDELTSRIDGLVCEDGKLHDHVFVCRAGAPYADEAYDVILDGISEGCLLTSNEDRKRLRDHVQTRLGHLLGYSAYEIEAFKDSYVARTCKCDCCGSEFTLTRQASDPNPSRFVEHAYQY